MREQVEVLKRLGVNNHSMQVSCYHWYTCHQQWPPYCCGYPWSLDGFAREEDNEPRGVSIPGAR